MNTHTLSRRQLLRRGLATGAALAWPSSPSRANDPTQIKPNVLVIFSDQQHWQALGCMDPFFDTPQLDALARASVMFENCFCTTPQCSPSRSSLLTGSYPSQTGVMGNIGAAGGKALAQPTLASAFKAAGYQTGYFGKWHLGNEPIATAGWDQHHFKVHDPSAESRAVAFLQQVTQTTQPFALFVSFNNPHDIYGFRSHRIKTPGQSIPLPVTWAQERFEHKPSIQKQFMLEDQGRAIWGRPRAEWERYRDCYRTKTRLYDDNVRTVLDALKARGLWDNTIIVATSDHGDMDTRHRLIFKGPFMYEHMVRIPLMIRVPAQFGGAGARRVTDLDVVNVDIASTLRELCALGPVKCDGMSLKPILTDGKQQQTRQFVIGQYYSKQRWCNPIRMIRTHAFKYNRYIRYGEELYDLKNDPHELINLARDPKYTSVKRHLSRTLDQWIKENQDPFYSLKATTRSGKILDAGT